MRNGEAGGTGGADRSRVEPAEADRVRYSEPMARGLIDRALRLGEAKQFKEYEQRVEAINRFEPEMELLDDAEIRAAGRRAPRACPRGGESLDDLLPEAFALVPRGEQADARPASLRRPADRRHGPPLRLHRRDEDRRGQDPDRDPARLPEHARRRQRPPRHRQRLPGPPRRRVDGAALRAPSASPSASSRTTTFPTTATAATPPTRPTSPTGPTPSSASTTCATTWRRASTAASSATTASRSSTRSTTSSSTRRGRR